MNVNWKIAANQEPIIFSRKAQWTGFHINHWRVMPGEMLEQSLKYHEITIPLAGRLTTEKHTATGDWRSFTGDGSGVCLLAAGQPIRASWEEEFEFIGINLNPEFVVQTALENNFSPDFEFIETFGMKDPLIKYIGFALLKESTSQSPVSRLYAESLSQTLIFHLLKNYTTTKQKNLNTNGGGLSGYKLRRVTEFINENLGEDLTLGEIAEAADLSQFHFARVFRQTTGLTPQAYVMQKRIEHAKQLLTVSDLSLVEVSLRTGFKNQSHFTTLFRKFTKLTPKMWRKLKQA